MSLRQSIHAFFINVATFTLTACCNAAQPPTSDSSMMRKADSLRVADTARIIIVGDLMGHGMQISGAWHDGGDSSYNYLPVFQYVKEYISSADWAIGNLEVTLAGAPYTGFPQFSSHSSFAVAIKDAGFDALVTANNHALDRGKQGVERTIDILDSLLIPHTGTFKDSAEWNLHHPLISDVCGIRIATLNYTYGTNGFPVTKPNVVNRIDTVRMAADLARVRSLRPDGLRPDSLRPDSLRPDFVLTCIHWGKEYQNHEDVRQRELARFLAVNGSDLIAGAHPHVVQPFAKVAVAGRDSVPVIYSLGNFVSNQRDRYRYGGIALDVTIVKCDSAVHIVACGYEPLWVWRPRDNNVSVFRLVPVNDYLLHPEKYDFSEADRKKIMQFRDDCNALLHNLPYSGFFKP